MLFNLNNKDFEVLKSIADYRALTWNQLSVLHFKNKQGSRRLLDKLKKEKLIEVSTLNFGNKSKGRPDNLISISEEGANFLKEKNIISTYINNEQITINNLHRIIEHQILQNWFRIYAVFLTRITVLLEVDFLSSNSPFVQNENNKNSIFHEYHSDHSAYSKGISFTPDCVFTLYNKSDKIKLLFFAEIDMATETLVSKDRTIIDISSKIKNYQIYFFKNLYKRYENLFKSEFHGFRLLFLCNDQQRMNALCKLVKEMPPCNFIWITTQSRMFEKGLGDTIWISGGEQSLPAKSILNSKLSCNLSAQLK